ncbi:hypothetical protein Tco_1283125 [Tanacetum coccineum]
MSSNSDDIQAASSDTRPPMLDRNDYESWSQQIRLYCRGKENGLQILQSIDQGPFELGTTRDTLGTTPEGGVLLGPERPRNMRILSDTGRRRTIRCRCRAPIWLQGLPKDIYKLINHNIEAKAIWDNVKMLLAELHFLRRAINFELLLTPEIKQPFKMVGLSFRMFKGDRIRIRIRADECDTFDSDVDDKPTAQTIFMANLSLAGSANPQAGLSNASILSETGQKGPTGIYDGDELLKPHHVPVIVPSSEEELELAKAIGIKLQ